LLFSIYGEVSYGYPTATASFTTGDLNTSGYSTFCYNTRNPATTAFASRAKNCTEKRHFSSAT
jgi:hypothetical protein